MGFPVGVIAQLVERRVRNAKVCGSIPHGSTIPSNSIFELLNALQKYSHFLVIHGKNCQIGDQ